MVEKGDLQKGHRYKISLQDCCIAGTLRGTFIAYKNYEGKDCDFTDDNFNEYEFDIGIIGYSYGPIDFEEIDAAASSS